MERFSGQSWVIIGDSHSLGPLGNGLIAALTQAGAHVDREGRVGRRAVDLTTGKEQSKLQQALQTQHYGVIFILGTNDNPGSKTEAAYRALQAAAHATGAQEIWFVGPPSFAPEATTLGKKPVPMGPIADANAKTAGNVFGDGFVDSRPITATLIRPPDRTSDKRADGSASFIHFTASGGQQWADGVWGVIQRATPATQAADAPATSVTSIAPSLPHASSILTLPAMDLTSPSLLDAPSTNSKAVGYALGAAAAVATIALVVRARRRAATAPPAPASRPVRLAPVPSSRGPTLTPIPLPPGVSRAFGYTR